MTFDIRTPDSAYDFAIEFASKIGIDNLIMEYLVNCEGDTDQIVDRWGDKIDAIDISDIEFIAFHVTTSHTECSDIQSYGLMSLQKVLSLDTELSRFLAERGVTFNIQEKTMRCDGRLYDIDYEKFKHDISDDPLTSIAHKVCYDPQVNAFFAHHDVTEYGGRVHKRPEFLYNIAQVSDRLRYIEFDWENETIPYLVTFKMTVNDFAWFTFYENEPTYFSDANRNIVKHTLFKWALDRAFQYLDESCERVAYARPDITILPSNIISITAMSETEG